MLKENFSLPEIMRRINMGKVFLKRKNALVFCLAGNGKATAADRVNQMIEIGRALLPGMTAG
jgi:hypothetical protein